MGIGPESMFRIRSEPSGRSRPRYSQKSKEQISGGRYRRAQHFRSQRAIRRLSTQYQNHPSANPNVYQKSDSDGPIS